MRLLYFLLAVFALLGLAYSLTVPLFEAPDELQHYATIQYIARYWWFPPLGQPGEHLWDQEALQAPLYYWLGAAATAPADTSDFARQAVLQPKSNIGDATLPGKKNAFLHGPEQAFPYRGTALAVHIARALSLLFGLGTVALAFVAARFVFETTDLENSTDRSDPLHSPNPLSLLAAAFLAFIPQFLFIHASANNDTAITFTATFTLAMLLWIARDGVTLRRAVLLGLAIGLMALSKLMGTVLAAVAVGLFVLFTPRAPTQTDRRRRATTGRPLRRRLALGVILGVAAAVSGWWYVRNQIVYGDPLALGAFLKFVGGNLDIPPLTAGLLWQQFRLLRFSTWGLFGHISVLMEPTWIYLIYDLIAFVGVLGVVIGAGRVLINIVQRQGVIAGVISFAAENRALAILVLWLGAVLAIAGRWFFAAGIQGRLIFPGLPALAILIIYGWRTIISYCVLRIVGNTEYAIRNTQYALTGLIILMATFAAAVVPLYLLPAYSPPPLVKTVPAEAASTEIKFADEIALRGYTIARNNNQLLITFYWETLRTPPVNYTLAIRLVRPDGSFWLDYVNYPGMGTSLPTTWKPGELRRDEYIFDLKRFEPANEPLRLIVGWFDPRTRMMTTVSGWEDVREAGWATLTQATLNDQ
jgi:4-amino-4-deoxy-L-arabinose transferase-like glycosyltransferase